MKGVVILVLAMLVIAVFMVHPNEAINCDEVRGLLSPCISFLTKGGVPSTDCCNGLSKLKADTPTTVDRQIACTCAKLAAIEFKVSEVLAQTLPVLCRVSITVPISSTVNCSTISLYEGYKWRGTGVL